MIVKGIVAEVQFDVDIAKQGGGKYQGARLVYRDGTGKLTEQAFHNNAFRFNPDLKKSLEGLSDGDHVEILKEKSEQGFWNVMSITKADMPSTASPASAKPAASPKSTYETPEERAKRQVYIVRQSSLTNAIAFFELTKAKPSSEKDIIALAKVFERFVFGIEDEEVM